MSEPSKDQTAAAAETPSPGRRRRRLPVWKKGLFALLVTTVFFVVMELLLAALGVKPVTFSEDPFVGFTSRSPLFDEVTGDDGEARYRTVPKKLAWFNEQEFPLAKKADDYRIFCVGGSTTYGRPYNDITSFSGWMREYLNAADSSHSWQVINAGGISYASYRVASLMEELINYQPDLFVIYCGQNEFLERRTYGDLMETPEFVRDTAAVLGRSRVYTTVRRLMNRSGSSAAGGESATDKLPEEVEAILDDSVGPDDYQRDEELQHQVIQHYRFNLVRMIEIARSAGAQVILVNPAANERSMSPFKSQHRDDLEADDLARWEQLTAEAAEYRESGEYQEALNRLDQAIQIDPLYADSHFRRGENLFDLDQFDEAKQAFQRAIDEDVCPLRILSKMRPVVAEVAVENDVPLIDYQQQLESKTDTGITGEEWFLDHVHPTIEGYRELAISLIDKMQSEGIVAFNDSWNQDAREEVNARVLAQVDDRAHGVALRNLAKVLSWARKYEEAGRLSQQAAGKLQDDAEAHCMAAYDLERRGQLEEAKKAYRMALELQPDYAQAHYNLGHVHRRLKEWNAAAQSFQRAVDSNPEFPGAHYNLGLVLQQAGQLDRAAQCFEASLQVNDQHPGTWEELGTVRLNQGRIDEAIRHLEQATKLEPRLASAHNSLGVAFAQRGQVEKAAEAFARAVEVNPDFAGARQNLEQARQMLKEKQ